MMNQLWRVKILTALRKEYELKSRKLEPETGVIFSLSSESKSLFTIYKEVLDTDFFADIAINKDQPKALVLMRILKIKHSSTTPKTRYQWPLVRVKAFNLSALDNTSYFVSRHKQTISGSFIC